MSTPNDKEMVWQARIQERAAHATKAVIDRLAAMPKSGFANLAAAERRDVHELVAKEIVETMYKLGTTVCAGAQDYMEATFAQVTLADKVAIKLVPKELTPEVLRMLADNRGKQVVLAFINGLAYSQAREALSKAIHREQTDWVQRAQDADVAEAEQSAASDFDQVVAGQEPDPDQVPSSFFEKPVDTENNQPGDLIADQPGDGSGKQEDTAPASTEAGAEDGPSAGPVPGSDDAGAEGSGTDRTDRDSPLARAGRRIRRRADAADRPAAH